MRRGIRVLIMAMVTISLMSGCGELLATKTSCESDQNNKVAKKQDDVSQDLIKEDSNQENDIDDTEQEEESSKKKSVQEQADDGKTELGINQIVVQVCGAVVTPGVYELDEGSRIEVAIKLAGGLTETAAYESVNQAEIAEDGQMIYVYRKEEYTYTEPSSGSGADDEVLMVNINRANKEELMRIPGIGETKAQLIITYREEHGDFSCIEDIMKIDGIKEGLFSQIKDKIEIE